MPYRLVIILVLIGLTGCLPSQQPPTKADIRATDTGGRVPAIVGAAGSQDPGSTDQLIIALNDEDPAVRLFAIQALNKRFSQTLGYRYYESEDKRNAAVMRWIDWLAEQEVSASPNTKTEDENPKAE